MSKLAERILRKELLNEKLQRNPPEASRDSSKLWLDKNENTDSEFQRFIAGKLKEVDLKSHFVYPDARNLYQKIAEREKIDISHLLLTAGSDGAIRAVFESCINPGDGIIKTLPSFAMYEVYSQMFGATPVNLVYERTDAGPRLNQEKLIEAIRTSRSKIVFLPNPDSPTGTVLSVAEVENLLIEAKKTDTVIFIDEAYYPFHEHTVLPLIQKYNNLLVARTFAKAWGLAGLRIGFLAGSQELIQYIQKIKPMYEVNTYALRVMEVLMNHEDEVMNSVRRLKEGKEYFFKSLAHLKLPTFPSHGNFFHVSFGSREEEVFQALSPIVLYRRNFNDECLKGYSRFSLAPKKIFEPIVERILRVYG